MSINFKLILAAALLTAGVASPALAQSFVPEAGTGNIVAGTPAPAKQINGQRSGLQAYAMVPDASATSNASGNTGGGSVGYNNMLSQY